MDQKNSLGKILKEARIKAKLTQSEVAEGAGIHVNYYARIERGEVNPTIDIVDSIAKSLNIKIKFPLETSK